jgi:hypothetical protein
MAFNDKSIIHSGYFGDSKENIIFIENFISPEDLMRIQDFCINLKTFTPQPGDPWDNRVCSGSMIKSIGNGISNLLSKYQEKIKNNIQEYFNVILNDNVPHIVIWRVGDGQAPHADKELPDGTPNMYPGNDIASLMYINDDYEGGEVYFPKQDVQIKPKAGSAIFFPGDKEYLHGVHTVTSGQRFTSPAFWNIKKVL